MEQIERAAGLLFQIGEVGLGGLPVAGVAGILGFEPALLTNEQITRDGVGVVDMEQLAATGPDHGRFLIELTEPCGTRGLLSAQPREHDLLNPIPLLGCECDGAVAVRDALLDLRDRECLALRTVVGTAAVADEILVDGAVLAARP